MPDTTALTVLTALTPVLVVLLGGVGWLYRHERERRTAAEHQVSERKYQAYITLLNIFFDMLKDVRHGKTPNRDAMNDKMIDAMKDLTLFSSDDVLLFFNDWWQRNRRGEVDLEQFGQLFVEIRRDMGSPRTRVTSDDVLRQLILDYDEMKAAGRLVARKQSDGGSSR